MCIILLGTCLESGHGLLSWMCIAWTLRARGGLRGHLIKAQPGQGSVVPDVWPCGPLLSSSGCTVLWKEASGLGSSAGSASAHLGWGPKPLWVLVSSLEGRSWPGEVVCSLLEPWNPFFKRNLSEVAWKAGQTGAALLCPHTTLTLCGLPGAPTSHPLWRCSADKTLKNTVWKTLNKMVSKIPSNQTSRIEVKSPVCGVRQPGSKSGSATQ